MIRIALALLLLPLFAACASLQTSRPTAKGFSVDQFELLTAEYSAPDAIVNIVPSGPADKGELCNFAGAASISQGDQGKSRFASTCLHIRFRGPIKHGAVVMQPFGPNQKLLEYGIFGIDYAADGSEISGTEKLPGPFKDADGCHKAGADLLSDAYRANRVPIDSSLLLYCVGFPVIPDLFHDDSEVKWQMAPSLPWEPLNGSAAQFRAGG